MTQTKTSNLTFDGLTSFLGKSNTKILANNTIAIKEKDYVSIQYHESIIVKVYRDKLEIDPHGYFTHTTKERLNWFLQPYHYSIFQHLFTWKVYSHETREDIGIVKGKFTFEFNNGFIGLESSGIERSKMITRIKKFAALYASALIDGKIESPSLGDCMFCSMFTQNNNPSFDHIDSHMDQSYFVPSLIMRAAEKYPLSRFTMGMIQSIWDKQDTSKTHHVMSDHVYNEVYKSIWKYCLYSYDRNK